MIRTTIILIGRSLAYIYFFLSFHFYERFFANKFKVTKKSNIKKRKKFCIIATNIFKDGNFNILEYLKCLKKNKYVIILINSGNKIEDKKIENLIDVIIIKSFFGRDFLSYKLGYFFLRKEVQKIEEVIFCNDSIFVIPKRLNILLNKIKAIKADHIALSEIYEFHYHFVSWFFVVREKLFYNNNFFNFWKNYQPNSNRRLGVSQGEVGLTQSIFNSNINSEILYPTANVFKLIDKLNSSNLKILKNYINYNLNDPLFSYLKDTKQIFKFIAERRNFIHCYNLILIKYLNFPFLKKDILYRTGIDISQLEATTSYFNHSENILNFFLIKGVAKEQNGIKHILSRLSII